jgi:glycosidase
MTAFTKTLIGLLLSLFCLSQATAQRIKRVEPPNWWVGMKYNQIELMVYGKGIGYMDVNLDYPGVILEDVEQVPNPNYLFVKLNISEEAQPGTLQLKFVDEWKKLTHDFPLLAREEGRAELQGFSASDVIYLITPDRFSNGDPSNDKAKGMKDKPNRKDDYGRHGGDIAGISQQLGYIADLGFTAIWSCPLMENDMPEYSYHGYAITDYYRVDPRFGTNEDYKNMVAAAREKGIKVIIDLVANHCGSAHWWMKDLPSLDWVNRWEDFTPTNHLKTSLLDPHVAEVDEKGFTDGWFVETMPDLNQRSPFLARYLIQNTLWWVEYAGLGGIRMDTYSYADKDFLREWTKTVMEEYPNFNIVGEEWSHLPNVIAYWQQGNENPDGYTSYLKSVMDFPLQTALIKSLNEPATWRSSWIHVYESLARDYLYPDPMNLLVFPDNHDMSRIFTELMEDVDSWRLAMSFFLTTRGIPQIYYGTEILMSHPGKDDHGSIRADFPGGWEGDEVNAFTGEGLGEKEKAAQEFMKTLLNWRKGADAIHSGELLHFAPQKNDVYVYFRYTETERVMVLLNKNTDAVELDLGRYDQGLKGAKRGTDVLSGKTFSLKSSLNIPARTPMILELEE